jgi:hypothetical protein
MPDLTPRAQRLVDELESKLNLSKVDAIRAAFTILAMNKGWSKARIGRHLGITRARVHQRIGKYEQYANLYDKLKPKRHAYPQVAACFKNGGKSLEHPFRDPGNWTEFSPDQWEDLDFAREMLNRVA